MEISFSVGILVLGVIGVGVVVVLGAVAIVFATSNRTATPSPRSKDEPQPVESPLPVESPQPQETPDAPVNPDLATLEQLLLQAGGGEGAPEAAELELLMHALEQEARDDGLAWRGSWKGKEVVLQSREGQHSLHLDGALVAETSGETTLRATIEGVAAVAAIRTGGGRRATLRIDGASVNLQRQPYDETLAPAPPQEPAPPAPDPRLAAVEQLVAQLQTQGDDVASLATRSLAEVRGLLEKIAGAEAAFASHRQLSGQGDDRLLRVIEQHRQHVDRLVEALRELHLDTIGEQGGPSRLLAELEVEVS